VTGFGKIKEAASGTEGRFENDTEPGARLEIELCEDVFGRAALAGSGFREALVKQRDLVGAQLFGLSRHGDPAAG
jgi:hypothetical protein